MNWYYLALISAIFSALAAVLEKKILFKEKALEFTFLLVIINAFLASFFLFQVNLTQISQLSLLTLFIKSILNALAFLCVMFAIKNLELSDALPLLTLTPGLIAIFAFIFLGETLANSEILGLLLLISGAYILGIKENQKILDPFKKLIKSKGHFYVISALLLFTITSILDKLILSKYKLPPQAFMAFQHLFYIPIFLVIFIIAGKKFNNIKETAKNSFWLIFILAIITIIYRYSEILAIKTASSIALVIAIKRISVFFAVIIGGRLFKEHNLVRKTIATLTLIAGALLVIRF